MIRIYTIYGLTLFSAFAVFWMFGVMSSVAARFTWVPFSGFLASIIHFGISSWIFLHFPKEGKIIAILTATIMSIWPIAALIDSAMAREWFGIISYFVPIICSGLVIYNHIKTFSQEKKPGFVIRIILSIIPFGLLIVYIFRITSR